ncbi:MAG: ANTAR domain-containing protein [Acidobacteriaceae bacterium]|nr:ANTAR domain-containing protein [Acidobacteriaceae bacterium]
MSALTQQALFAPVHRRLSEPDAMREIGRRALAGLEVSDGLATIAETVFWVSGIRQIAIEAAEGWKHQPATLGWGGQPGHGPQGCAVAGIRANGRDWGELRLYFDVQAASLQSPLRFAKFVAQQIAAMLNRLELSEANKALRGRIARIEHRLKTRKAVQRAKGILARTRGISEADAIRLLVRYSREERRSLYQISEAVILADEDSWGSRPVLRQLRPDEITGGVRPIERIRPSFDCHRDSLRSAAM